MKHLRNLVGGAFSESVGGRSLAVENPSTGETIARVPLATAEDVDGAAQAARAAFPEWRRTPVGRRCEYLYRLLDLIRREEEDLARLITRENGKSVVDSRAEMKRLIENLEVACAMPILQQGDKLIGASYEIDGEVLRVPVGVFAMFGPFNFPGMVPFWFLPYALASGNTFIMKPSEQTPCTMGRIAELVDEAGLPPGVFNLVHGDKEVATALMDHPEVDGVSMVGSTEVCRLVVRRCAEQGKRVQAMGGAKNHLVVMPDGRIDQVVQNMLTSCFGCAGQRCMAASAIVCVGEETHRRVAKKFVEAARGIKIGNPLDPENIEEPMLLGPVISAASLDRIHSLIEKGVGEGAELLLDGRDVKMPESSGGHFIGPTILDQVQPGSTVHKTEIFGPVVVILKADTLDEAIGIVNDHAYGNGASIYTQDGYLARKFKLEAEAGMIGVNVGIPAPVASLPFGGMKASQWADIKAQGKAVVHFFTQEKIVTERYWKSD